MRAMVWMVAALGLTSPAAAAPEGAAEAPAACVKWAEAVCDDDDSSLDLCHKARDAAEILPEAACAAASKGLAFTIARGLVLEQICTGLIDRLCAAIGPDTQTCSVVRAQGAKLTPDRCREMEQDFDAVVTELKAHEAKNGPLSEALAARQVAGDPPADGPADAKVSIVEYSDYQCPYCATAATVLSRVKKHYKDQVRVVVRHFPLSFHKQAQLAAEASLEAHRQGRFWPFHHLLFKNQRTLERADLVRLADQAGLDVAAFESALDSRKHKAQVDQDKALAEDVGVSGTPTVIVGRERVRGGLSFERLADIVDRQLRAAGETPPAR